MRGAAWWDRGARSSARGVANGGEVGAVTPSVTTIGSVIAAERVHGGGLARAIDDDEFGARAAAPHDVDQELVAAVAAQIGGGHEGHVPVGSAGVGADRDRLAVAEVGEDAAHRDRDVWL